MTAAKKQYTGALALVLEVVNLNQLATRMKIPRQTAYYWAEVGRIPRYRLAAVSEATGIPLATLENA